MTSIKVSFLVLLVIIVQLCFAEEITKEPIVESKPPFNRSEINNDGRTRNAIGVFALLNIDGNWYQKPTSCINTEHGSVNSFDFLSCQVGVTYSNYVCCESYITYYKQANCLGSSYRYYISTGFECGTSVTYDLRWYEPYPYLDLWWEGALYEDQYCECNLCKK